MQPILHAFYTGLMRARIAVIVLVVALALLAGSGMARLGFSNDYRDFFPADDPHLVAFEALQENFLRNNNVFIAVEAVSGDMYTPGDLQRLADLTDALWHLPFVIRVDSLANHQFILSDEDTIAVRDLVTMDRAITPGDAAEFRTMALAEKATRGLLASEDPAMAGINILVDKDGITETGKAELMAALAALLAGYDADFRTYRTGSLVVDHGFDVAAQADLEVFYLAMYAIVLALVGLLTRSVVATVAILVTMTLSWFVALGLSALAGINLTAISVAAPTVLMTISVAQAMHIVFAVQKAQKPGMTREARRQSVAGAMLHTFKPLLLVSASTLIGFSTIMLSEVPPLRDMGFILTVGTLALLVLSITFLPAFLSFFDMSNPRLIHRANRQMIRLADFISARTQTLALGIGVVSVALIAALPLNRINDNFIEYFSAGHPVRSDAMHINATLTGVHYAYLQADAVSGSVFDPAYLAEIDRFAAWLETQPEVHHVSSYADNQKRLNQALAGDAPEAYALPSGNADAAQLHLLYELSLPFGMSTENLVSFDRSATKITVVLDNISSDQLLALEDRIATWTGANADHVAFGQLTGPMSMFAHIGQRNARGLLVSTFVALTLVSLLLIVAVRSVTLGLISIVPNLLPAALAFGIWGLIDGQIGLAVSIVTVMTFGIVVDDTIFLMSRIRQHLRPGDFAGTLRRALRDTGRPVINTTIILVAGFALLALSSFRLNQGLGILTVLVMGIALIADLFLLPGLLRRLLFKRDRGAASRADIAAGAEPIRGPAE